MDVEPVAPGEHTIYVMPAALDVPARVVIEDSGGQTMVEHSEDPDGDLWAEAPHVELELGTYLIRCSDDAGRAGSATLRVVPVDELE